jgi:hypothetical protein
MKTAIGSMREYCTVLKRAVPACCGRAATRFFRVDTAWGEVRVFGRCARHAASPFGSGCKDGELPDGVEEMTAAEVAAIVVHGS